MTKTEVVLAEVVVKWFAEAVKRVSQGWTFHLTTDSDGGTLRWERRDE